MQSGEDQEMENMKRKLGDMEARMTRYNINLGQTRENCEKATSKEIKAENFVELKKSTNPAVAISCMRKLPFTCFSSTLLFLWPMACPLH